MAEEPSSTDATPDSPGQGPRWWEVVGAVLIGLGIGVAVFVGLRGGDDEASSTTFAFSTVTVSTTTAPTTTGPSTTVPPSTGAPSETITATEAVPLLDAFRRSIEATFAIDGELVRTRNGQSTVVEVRQAHRAPRRLDELGAVSVVIDGDTLRQCDRSSGTVLCTDPEPAATNEQRYEQFVSLVGGESSLYDVFTPDNATIGDLATPPPGATSVSCWTIVARVVGQGQRFGDEASLCFDDGTGALVSRLIRNGDTEERFRTLSLRSEVVDDDLDPSRS